MILLCTQLVAPSMCVVHWLGPPRAPGTDHVSAQQTGGHHSMLSMTQSARMVA